VSADILKGRRVTSFASVKDDMVLAGADWTDEPVVVDRKLVTSRRPADLPFFMKEVIANIAKD
jgi:protease I